MVKIGYTANALVYELNRSCGRMHMHPCRNAPYGDAGVIIGINPRGLENTGVSPI